MDYTLLQKRLFTLSKKEIAYQRNQYEPGCSNTKEVTFYEFLPQFYGIQNQEYSISVHKRFNPVTTHTHETCEISYIYSGTCVQFINGQEVHLTSGDVLILDRNVPHSIEPVKESDIIVNFQMKNNFFTPSFQQSLVGSNKIGKAIIDILSNKKEKNYIIFHTKENGRIRSTVENILFEHFEQHVANNQIINAYMMVFLGLLLRNTPSYVDLENSDDAKKLSIANILNYIEKNFIEESLEITAQYFMYSPAHLSRLLKKHTGKTYKELITEQRIQYAAHLLTITDDPIYNISENIGIKNINHFYYKFKEYYGITPNEYRLQKR